MKQVLINFVFQLSKINSNPILIVFFLTKEKKNKKKILIKLKKKN